MKNEKSLTVKQETVHVVNPITGKSADVVIHRDGHTDQKLAMVLMSPDASKEQKDSWVSNWLFERGKENASFIAELFVSKGVHLKETQAFKRQVRFDFESFANSISILFRDLADDIKSCLGKEDKIGLQEVADAVATMADRLQKGAELIERQREKITEARMREIGYGVYLDRNGQAFSIFDEEIESAIKNDKEEIQNEKQNTKEKDGIKDDDE